MTTLKKSLTLLSFIVLSTFIGCGTSSATNKANQSTSYSLTEVAQHASKSDCWLVINNQVYDVTEYIPEHPGRDRILEGCGQDATALFTGTSPLGRVHSALAIQLLSKYLIGELSQ